jgi:rhodanese-related sulfurtransferase
MRQITAGELAAWLDDGARPRPQLLDVREPWEYEVCHIDGSRHVPMASVPAHLSEFEASAAVVVVCHHGVRSAHVGLFLERQGFGNVLNLAGGVAAWAAEVDPHMPQY